MFESAGTGMALLDPNSRFLKSNRAFETLVGYSEEELQMMFYSDLTTDKKQSNLLKKFNNLITGKLDRYRSEHRYLHRDWNEKFGSLTATATALPNRKLVIVCIIEETIEL